MTASRRIARRRRIALAAATLGAAATLSSLTTAPVQAEPSIGELITSAGDILRQLPIDRLPLDQVPESTGNLSTDLPSLFTLLIPRDYLPDRTNPTPLPALPPTGDRRTSCTQVIHIGDSTSVGIDSASKVTDEADRLTPQYKRVGVTDVTLNASGGRSVVERVDGEPNAVDAIESESKSGRRGCWVIAMGVNDAANIAVGSTVKEDARIDAVMKAVNGQNVLWPTVMTTNPGNKAYAPANMKAFNDALKRATSRYPNLKVYDFAAEAQPTWYVDGIHYNATGTAQRNRLFATALATAFPA